MEPVRALTGGRGRGRGCGRGQWHPALAGIGSAAILIAYWMWPVLGAQLCRRVNCLLATRQPPGAAPARDRDRPCAHGTLERFGHGRAVEHGRDEPGVEAVAGA